MATPRPVKLLKYLIGKNWEAGVLPLNYSRSEDKLDFGSSQEAGKGCPSLQARIRNCSVLVSIFGFDLFWLGSFGFDLSEKKCRARSILKGASVSRGSTPCSSAPGGLQVRRLWHQVMSRNGKRHPVTKMERAGIHRQARDPIAKED